MGSKLIFLEEETEIVDLESYLDMLKVDTDKEQGPGQENEDNNKNEEKQKEDEAKEDEAR